MICLLKEELSQNGLKATNQRLGVLKYLKQTKEHPSAAMVRERLAEENIYTSTATVYNILMDFTSRGMIRKIGEFDGAGRFDYNIKDHINESLLKQGIEVKEIDMVIVTQ